MERDEEAEDELMRIQEQQRQEEHPQHPSFPLRFIYPEFLPDPNPKWRNHTAEKLARKDLLRRYLATTVTCDLAKV